MPAKRMSYSITHYEGINVLNLTGSLTVITADDFRYIVDDLIQRGSLIINMRHANFITSSGLNALLDVSYYAKEKERRIVLLNPDNDLTRLVDFMNYYTLLIFAGSPEESKTKIDYYI